MYKLPFEPNVTISSLTPFSIIICAAFFISSSVSIFTPLIISSSVSLGVNKSTFFIISSSN